MGIMPATAPWVCWSYIPEGIVLRREGGWGGLCGSSSQGLSAKPIRASEPWGDITLQYGGAGPSKEKILQDTAGLQKHSVPTTRYAGV